MTFNSPADMVITLRVVSGSLTAAFAVIVILRLGAQYRARHYAQSIYLIMTFSALLADALLRTVALTIFPNTATVITPSALFFLIGQWLITLGVVIFMLYLIGIVNGFWIAAPNHGSESNEPQPAG